MRNQKFGKLFLAGLWIAGLSFMGGGNLVFGQVGRPTPPDVPPAPHAVKVKPPSAQATGEAKSPPAWMAYRFFFNHLASLEKLADEKESSGKLQEAAGWRTYEQRAMGLTNDETSILKQVALACNRAVLELDAQLHTVALASQEAMGDDANALPITNSRFDVDAAKKLTQLRCSRTQAVEAGIEQLRSLLDAETFGKLDQRVGSRFQPTPEQRATVTSNRHSSPLDAEPSGGPTPGPGGSGGVETLLSTSIVYVYSATSLTGTSAWSECGTEMDEVTAGVYLGTFGQCYFKHFDTLVSEYQCAAASPETSATCAMHFDNIVPGDLYSTSGYHGLYLYQCTYGGYWDPFDYAAIGIPYLQDRGYVYSNLSADFCLSNYFVDVAVTIGTGVKSGAIAVDPQGVEVLPGSTATFTATITPSTLPQAVNWTADLGEIGLNPKNPAQALFSAPRNELLPGNTTVTIKACSQTYQTFCGANRISVPKVTVTITGPNALAAGATATFSDTVLGPHAVPDVKWTVVSGGGNIVNTGLTTAEYTAPTGITALTNVQLQACLLASQDLCGTSTVAVVPPVTVNSITPITWPSGAHDGNAIPVTINATGIVGTPTITVNDSRIQCIMSNLTPLQCQTRVPLIAPEINVQVTVSSTTLGITQSGTIGGITIAAAIPSVTAAVSAGTTSLQFSQKVSFTAVPQCRLSNQVGCLEPVAGMTWSVPAGFGTITQTGPLTAEYQATASVATQTNAPITACAIWNPQVGVCSTVATVTLLVQTVIVTPSTASLRGCDQPKQFTAAVTNGPTPVTWSIVNGTSSSGAITPQGGLYTPPCPYVSGVSSTITVQACSSDPKRCGSAAVTLTPVLSVGSIGPAEGPMSGGTQVAITGTGFQTGATVSIGGTAATGSNVVNGGLITALTPAHSCGPTDVVVTNPPPNGLVATLPGAFFYTSPDPPTGLFPNGATLPSTTTSVTLTWAATPGATQYAVRVQDNMDGLIQDPRNTCSAVYLCVNGVIGTSYSVPVRAGHSYSWWVHSGSSCGQYSAQTNASFTVAVEPLHAPTGLAKDASSRNLLWTPPDNLTPADQVSYDLRITGGANCSSGCLYHPGAPSWYTMGAEIGSGTYSWTLKANSASRASSGAVSGPTFTILDPPLHAPTNLSVDVASRNLLWTPPDNLTAADQVSYDLWITGGANCPSGCLYHPGAPSWYTMGAFIGPGSYSWTLKANSVSRASSGAVSGPAFTISDPNLHAPANLSVDVASRNLLWTPPDNLTAADQVSYDLWIYGGVNCAGGCLYRPGAPSWYTMGGEIGSGSYTWTLKANSASRPFSGAVSGPAFNMP